MRGSFVHQDARYEEIGESRTVVESFVLRGNRESRIGVDYSCNKLHATRESWIAHRGWIIRATSCTLRGNRGLRISVKSFVHQDARYEEIVNYALGLNLSCIKMHATRELVNRVPGLNHSCNKLHATRCKRCTLRASCKTLPLRIKKARHFHVVLFC